MKTYTVSFTEPVAVTSTRPVWDKDKERWEDKEVTEMKKSVVTHSLTWAKKLIRANRDKYKDSCITKIWSNGDWENLGPISISSSNKTFVANTRQKKASY